MARRRYDPRTTHATWAGVDLRAAALEVDELRGASRLFDVDRDDPTHARRRDGEGLEEFWDRRHPASLATKRALAKYTGIPLRRYRVSVRRWKPPHERLDVGVHSLEWFPVTSFATKLPPSELEGPWRVRVELWLAQAELGTAAGKWRVYDPNPLTATGQDLTDLAKALDVDGHRIPRGRRYFTALGEAAKLEDATGQALVLLDEVIGKNWYAVKLEPSPSELASWAPWAAVGIRWWRHSRQLVDQLADYVRAAVRGQGVEPTRVDVTRGAPGEVNVAVEYRSAGLGAHVVDGAIRNMLRDELPMGVEARVDVRPEPPP